MVCRAQNGITHFGPHVIDFAWARRASSGTEKNFSTSAAGYFAPNSPI